MKVGQNRVDLTLITAKISAMQRIFSGAGTYLGKVFKADVEYPLIHQGKQPNIQTFGVQKAPQ